MKPPWSRLLQAAQSSPVHQHTALLITMAEFLTQEFLIFCLALLIENYDQPKRGDQKKKENMGRSCCHVGIQLPQSRSDQTSTVPSPGFSSTCSREENEQVRV